MSFINPISKANWEENKEPTPMKISKRTAVAECPSKRGKTHNIKFPVSQLIQMKLKTYCKQSTRILKKQGTGPLSQTMFNNRLLRFGLDHMEIIQWELVYQDTKTYMHVTPLEKEYEVEIGGPYGLSISKNLSDRKVVYLIVTSVLLWMEREGSLEKILS
ncbi:hypothetical protein [Heyndrickxia acidicola]|uniref:Uncharacterized protein n=1 Tax=Heyndrickxia acidicola TaxID=209389 RepID=A0ABU6MJW9_9BACI|nr:hypothetical protein [Heyndrickxia acidicola]MED1203537.1 hypothetical protein [Heyndrickxia acidicola]